MDEPTRIYVDAAGKVIQEHEATDGAWVLVGEDALAHLAAQPQPVEVNLEEPVKAAAKPADKAVLKRSDKAVRRSKRIVTKSPRG